MLQMSEQHLATMENAKLHSKVRELEASLIGEKELNKQLQRALHRMASEKTADEGGALAPCSSTRLTCCGPAPGTP